MDLQGLAAEIAKLVDYYKLDFSAAWISRKINQEADFMSKSADKDSWTISDSLFRKIEVLTKLKFEVDLFANDNNTKCTKFYSKYACPNSLGMDSLQFLWTGVVWAVPPPSIATKVLFHMQKCKVKGVLIIPEWFSLPVWPLLENDNFSPFLKAKWSYPGKLYLKCNDQRSIFNSNFKGGIRVLFYDFTED